ncbi:hypothetical protein U9M48_002057 [Paspalum notatum var. saurae]|uniref:Uncharacterized protein n=1 Tax=Paspalum notatum var. saurae TaxID=547442 RepID=A0AAQ3SD98_PASNO
MIIMDEMAFRAVEGEGFIKYSNTLQPRFEIPSRTTVARDAMQIFLEEKAKMKKVLKKQRVCLITDAWTSNQNINYMCLTVHWIDAMWQLQTRLKITNEKLLEERLKNIYLIDNASSNDGAINYIKDLSKAREGVVLEHEFIHMRCSSHILDLTDPSIDKIRIAVRLRSSPKRLAQFKKCVEKEKISRKNFWH